MSTARPSERKSLLSKIRKAACSPVMADVHSRMSLFDSCGGKDSLFSELCFCLLTANSRASTAMKIQAMLGSQGFLEAGAQEIRQCIRALGHRFHNKKTQYIIMARRHADKIEGVCRLCSTDSMAARDWLVRNVKGLGYKEASHFLRNTGCRSLAILDRHILGLLAEHGVIRDVPSHLSGRKYLEIEELFVSLAKDAGLKPAELDMLMWHMKTGSVLK